MDLLTQILIGLGLSMDAVAVSIAGGANARKQNKVYMAALIAALFFGFFQGGMFLIGGYGGEQLKNSIANLDHWIAFFLLAAIGGKMIYESMTGAEEEKRSNLRELHKIIVLAFATSIDA
jgi:putative Mn2+ efflux pump MntP